MGTLVNSQVIHSLQQPSKFSSSQLRRFCRQCCHYNLLYRLL